MKTLIVNCYRKTPDKSIENYCKLIGNFSLYDVVYDKDIKEDFKIDNYNAIVISGSENCISKKQYSPDFLEFLKQISIPVLGICYGHQIIAKALGVEVKRGTKMIKMPCPENPTDHGEKVHIIDKDEIFIGLDNKIDVFESHQEYVNPEYLDKFRIKLLASSKSCPVEAFKHLKRPLYGVQFHIERSGETGKKIMRNFYELVVQKF
ncbi:MAG: gamma-glutamyl-gamma-aminobutyrate hydrolase family protein [Actinobacteria bacterium]|nr:gamma-glutamyl-gamma-aminobutyrate hydrolase family protein [Actinomycetota bacterium]